MLPKHGSQHKSPSSGVHELAERLAACDLFASVPLADLARQLQQSHYGFSRHRRSAILAFRGDQYDRLICLLSGAARSEMSSYRGKNYAVAEHTAPCVLAPALLFGKDNTLPISIVLTADSDILRIPRTTVLELCHDHEAFLRAYLDEVSDRLSTLADKLRLSRLATIRERVAEYLLDLCDRQGTRTLELPHSRQTMAEIMGVTRPALSRVFAELAEDGIIRYDRGTVQVLDLDSLIELAPE